MLFFAEMGCRRVISPVLISPVLISPVQSSPSSCLNDGEGCVMRLSCNKNLLVILASTFVAAGSFPAILLALDRAKCSQQIAGCYVEFSCCADTPTACTLTSGTSDTKRGFEVPFNVCTSDPVQTCQIATVICFKEEHYKSNCTDICFVLTNTTDGCTPPAPPGGGD